MIIAQELQGLDGNLRVDIIKDVYNFCKADNLVLKGFENPMSVIWCNRQNNKSYPMAFTTVDKRDTTFELLRKAKYEYRNEVYLDLVEHFYSQLVSPSVVSQIITLPLSKHLRFKLEHFLSIDDVTLGDVHKIDAFNVFTIQQLGALRLGKSVVAGENALRLWAKTLGAPKYARSNGINPLQFFKQLSYNEEVEHFNRVNDPILLD